MGDKRKSAELPANANSSGSVDGSADPAESCIKDPTDLNIRTSLAAENEKCTKNNAPKEKGQEASHTDSQERKMSTARNFANVKAMKAKNWACVNFSSLSGKSVLRFLRKLGKMCLSIGMELSLEPTLLIQKNSYTSTDIQNSLWTVHRFFDDSEMMEDKGKFILVILPETRMFDDFVRDVCKLVRHAHHCCLPQYDMMLSNEYLEDVANEIKKVVEYNSLSYSSEDMSKDENSDGSDSETEIMDDILSDSCNDMSEEDDDNEQSVDSKETGFVQPNSSSDVLVEDVICEMHAGSSEDNEDDGFSDEVGRDVKIWGCVSFSRMHGNKAYKFFQKLKCTCMHIGMDFNPLPSVFLHEVSACPTDIENTLWQARDWMPNRDRIDLLIVILPDTRSSDDKVRKVCDTMGVTYKCCLPKFARMQSKKYLLEAAHEIKAKIVERRTHPLRKAIPFVSEPTIVFGADISHCILGEGYISIASLVASMNWPEVSKYRTVVNYQPHSEVVINGDMVSELLFAFKKKAKKRPQKIIFFRHGIVGSLSLSSILSVERGAIKKACASLEYGYEPTITFVVVTSQGMSEMTDTSENSLPGIEIGEGGPDPTDFEFFCNHAAHEGTSMLAHYRVIHDDNNFTVDQIKYICNNLFTPHDRWAYPQMSMVPPTFFASQVASRARNHVEEQISSGRVINDPSTLCFKDYVIFC